MFPWLPRALPGKPASLEGGEALQGAGSLWPSPLTGSAPRLSTLSWLLSCSSPKQSPTSGPSHLLLSLPGRSFPDEPQASLTGFPRSLLTCPLFGDVRTCVSAAREHHPVPALSPQPENPMMSLSQTTSPLFGRMVDPTLGRENVCEYSSFTNSRSLLWQMRRGQEFHMYHGRTRTIAMPTFKHH